jgi:(p)ppGpp synthase/HD superfamily hydrolase
VALRVAEATEGRDANLVAAALLHDTIEDTPVTHEELELAFGQDIAGLVAEVTDDKSLEKHERKELQVTEASGKSDRARMLKLADKASNLASLVASPPDWPVEIQLQYADWAERVGQGLKGVNERLEREFDAAVAALRQHHA